MPDVSTGGVVGVGVGVGVGVALCRDTRRRRARRTSAHGVAITRREDEEDADDGADRDHHRGHDSDDREEPAPASPPWSARRATDRGRTTPNDRSHGSQPHFAPFPAAGELCSHRKFSRGAPCPKRPSSRAVASRRPAELTAAGGVMTQRQIMFVIFGLMAGMFLSSLNQTVVGTSMRTIADDLDGLALQAWVTTAFLIVLDRDDPDLRQAQRHLRPPAAVHPRDRDLPRRIDPLHIRGLDVPAGDLPRAAGPRRRWPHGAAADDHGRHPRPTRTREVPGLLPRRLRHLERHRPADRRPLRRQRLHPRHRPAGAGCS